MIELRMRIGRLLGGSSHEKEPGYPPTPVPQGAHVISTSLKEEYDIAPVHVYHPTPHDAITVLRHKKRTHEWLVAGWYLGTYREGNQVKGLMYRRVQSDQDKEVVVGELKKQDKEAVLKFSLE